MRATAVIALFVAAATARAGPAPLLTDAPPLASPAAIVIDTATGTTLVAADPDAARPIASLTKIFVVLVVRRRHLDLDAWTEITDIDAAAAAGGAGTRLLRGESFRNLDLLHAMLLVSDNRVPTALARAVGLSPHELVDAMNELASGLGLAHTTFVDPTGIRGNRSTARELAVAFEAALADPVVARIMSTRRARITSRSEAVTIDYRSTVQPLWDGIAIRGGKTGHTRDAGYCFVVGAEIGHRRVVMAFLGGQTPAVRFADFAAIARWLGERAAIASRRRR